MSRDPHQRQPLQGAVGAHEVLDEVVRWCHQELRRGGVLGQDPTLAQDRDPVAHLDRLVDVVGDEQDRLAHLGLEAQELVLELLAVDRVDGPERLVHQHHTGVGGERARHPDALLLAARELRRVAVAKRRVDPHQAHQLLDPSVDAGSIPTAQPRNGGDVVGDRAVGEQPDLLDHVADLAPQLGGRALAHGGVADEDVALGDLDHAVDHPHRGRLAASRRTDEDADVAARHLEVELSQGRLLGARVALRRPPEGDRGGLHRPVRGCLGPPRTLARGDPDASRAPV